MMLTLRAVSLNGQPLTQPITGHFSHEGGTIGRADQNNMALPDPERHISRKQAQIKVSGEGYVIENVGTANPIVVRGRALLQGESVPLMPGDQIRIGDYLLEVVEEGADSGSTMIAGVRVAPEPSHEPSASPTWPSRLPDDFDPFAPPTPRAPVPAPPTSAGGAFDDLIAPAGASSTIDDLFGLKSGNTDPLANFLSSDDASPTDPMALFGRSEEPRSRNVAAAPTVPDNTPELRSAFNPPRVLTVADTPPVPPAPTETAEAAVTPAALAVAPQAPPWPGDLRALWRAFCEGADLEFDPPQGLNPELMRTIGTLIRTAIEGTLQLMAVRATTKHELRAEVTMIQSRDNNPLKFSPDAQSALQQLLQPPLRGFLPGPVALNDAMVDLVGHAIGTMAGTRAAIEGVLERFSPKELESLLTGKSVLDNLLPMNRKARLWELYLQHYASIRDEAQEDFHNLFGKAFVAAYKQQLDNLRLEKSLKA